MRILNRFLKNRRFSSLKQDLIGMKNERKSIGITDKPLDAELTSKLCELLNSKNKNSDFYMKHFTERIPPGVDEAAYVKASYLTSIVNDKV